MKTLQRLFTEDQGQGLVEYILIIAAVAVVCVVGLQLVGTSASNKLAEIAPAIA